ncbi:MAG TPA: entericidin A/B family lipoprotein [Tepidisphaeraceae bacterium]
MKNVTKYLSAAALALVLGGFSIACNTTEGVGKDVEGAGDAMKDAARDAKN